ncbi:hypothetical protein EV130_104163 [Rhizobium azibense]|uniref:Uncharacterized protein n=1 Tax=Rhizobium azibense TaxID=1136135 RepID=A0A4R3R146_9HYPH|nr:hypothetical protein EV130_104163 [Rhizobium azibense]
MQPEKFADNRQASVDLELRYLRFIPYGDTRSLVSQIVLFTNGFEPEMSRAKASVAAADALGGYLWEVVRQPAPDPFFAFSTEGQYELLHHQVDHAAIRSRGNPAGPEGATNGARCQLATPNQNRWRT